MGFWGERSGFQAYGSGLLNTCLEGQGDLVSGLIRGITRVTVRVIGIIYLLAKSP